MRRLCLAGLLLATSALHAESLEDKLKTQLAQFYQLEVVNSVPLTTPQDLRQIQDAVTPSLFRALQQMVAAQQRCGETAAQDEKPLGFETSVFSTLYEGYSEATLVALQPQNSQHLQAIMAFAYRDSSSPEARWHDQLSLRRVGTRWRIDDIQFNVAYQQSPALHNNGWLASGTLRQTLQSFMQEARGCVRPSARHTPAAK
ncbi:hypothetical protein [Leeia aquatica]|uniref:DUF3828 domain-containing protein n=1 Tax=Leeia aquatica TaxID=2725557 RepID=A0A847SEM5_9NEIS|nr:hypothetical protein [Leeia aquatica]NLR75648.1 hypothetical protein [Leeia aquatica]